MGNQLLPTTDRIERLREWSDRRMVSPRRGSHIIDEILAEDVMVALGEIELLRHERDKAISIASDVIKHNLIQRGDNFGLEQFNSLISEIEIREGKTLRVGTL